MTQTMEDDGQQVESTKELKEIKKKQKKASTCCYKKTMEWRTKEHRIQRSKMAHKTDSGVFENRSMKSNVGVHYLSVLSVLSVKRRYR